MKGFIFMLTHEVPTFFTKEFRRKPFNILKFILNIHGPGTIKLFFTRPVVN